MLNYLNSLLNSPITQNVSPIVKLKVAFFLPGRQFSKLICNRFLYSTKVRLPIFPKLSQLKLTECPFDELGVPLLYLQLFVYRTHRRCIPKNAIILPIYFRPRVVSPPSKIRQMAPNHGVLKKECCMRQRKRSQAIFRSSACVLSFAGYSTGCCCQCS